MEINGCLFPEGLYYSDDMNIWLVPEGNQGDYRVGITSAVLWTAGKPIKTMLKELGTLVGEGKSIGSVESPRFFDTLRMPFECTIVSLNSNAAKGSDLDSNSIYERDWLAIVRPAAVANAASRLLVGDRAKEKAKEKVLSLRLNCFSLLPDREMVEIGTECSAVLAKLNELMEDEGKGFTVHLVTDDVTSPMEMVRWSDESGNRIAETRKLENIYHFIAVKE